MSAPNKTGSIVCGATIRSSFEQLFWPAVAGNVAWSLCSVVISPGKAPTDIWSRILGLLLLAWYSWYGWLRFATISYRPRSYYFMDGLHLITLAAFAIATANHHPWTPYFLAAIFGVALVGHICGSFNRAADERFRERLKRAGANLIGLLVIVFSLYLGILRAWSVVLALGLVLPVWWYVQKPNPQ